MMIHQKSKSGLRGLAPDVVNRRRFLRALGLGGAGLAAASLGIRGVAEAGPTTTPPVRLVFWITPHGTVWPGWNMNAPGLGAGTSSAPLSGIGSWSRILGPLQSRAADLTIVEGLARSACFPYEEQGARLDDGRDLNRHHFGQAMLLTCQAPMQRAGATCIGGARSVDQVIADATVTPGRWGSRVYGDNHQHPYSFVSAGTEAPRVSDPRTAFNDIVGLYTPPSTGMPTRAERIREARASVLDFAAQEYDLVAPRVGAAERAKLETHRDLIRSLEASFMPPPGGFMASCAPTWSDVGHRIDQWNRVTALALACDMTRMVSFVTPNLNADEFTGIPGSDVHQDYAHASVQGTTSYTAEGERGMIEYNRFYAERFASFVDTLAGIPEGSGSLLDNTMVVWMSELGTGNHDLHDLPIVIAGGGGGYLTPGRYVRYAREHTVRAGWGMDTIGPSHSQLYVTLMRGMGMDVDRFGIDSIPLASGGTLSLTGSLSEITG